MSHPPGSPAEVATKLGVTLPQQMFAVVVAYAAGLPIEAAHVVEIGVGRRVYWVSGDASLVILNLEPADRPLDAQARGDVKLLKSASVDIEATSTAPMAFQDWRDWRVARTVKLYFPNEAEPLVLPDPRSSPPSDDLQRERVNAFLNAVLRACSGRARTPGQ